MVSIAKDYLLENKYKYINSILDKIGDKYETKNTNKKVA
jgi:transcription termination factor NusB